MESTLPQLKTVYLDKSKGHQDFFKQYFIKTSSKAVKRKLDGTAYEELGFKEIAKHKALFDKKDLSLYSQLDAKAEYEVTLQDVVDKQDGQSRASSQQEENEEFLTNSDAGSIDDDTLADLQLGFDKEALTQQDHVVNNEVQIQMKQFLQQHSGGLSQNVQDYLTRLDNPNVTISPQERISSLGLLAFERTQFIQTFEKLRKAFRTKLKDHSLLEKAKIKGEIKKGLQKIRAIFVIEFQDFFRQYNEIYDALRSQEKETMRLQRTCTELEHQLVLKDQLLQFYTQKGAKVIEAKSQEDTPQTQLQRDANSLLKQPFAFYSSYIQLSKTVKEEVVGSLAVQKQLKRVQSLQMSLKEKDDYITSLQCIIDVFAQQQDQYDENIRALEHQLQCEIRETEREQQRFELKYRRLYDEFQLVLAQTKEDKEQYMKLSEVEMQVKDALVDKLVFDHQKISEELRTTKTVLVVPRLRNQLNQFDLRSMGFQEFKHEIDQLVSENQWQPGQARHLIYQDKNSDDTPGRLQDTSEKQFASITLSGKGNQTSRNQREEEPRIDQSEVIRGQSQLQNKASTFIIAPQQSSFVKHKGSTSTVASSKYGAPISSSKIQTKRLLNHQSSQSPKSTQITASNRNSNTLHRFQFRQLFKDNSIAQNNSGMFFTLGNFGANPHTDSSGQNTNKVNLKQANLDEEALQSRAHKNQVAMTID